MASYNCSSCGAAIEITNRFSKVVVCSYCGTHHSVNDNGLDPSGKHPKLAEYPSIFKVGSSGTILGKPFKALGRIKYKYDGGYFTEWFLDYDEQTAWFTEDEGTYSIYTDLLEAVDIPNISALKAGQNIDISGKKVMIKEKGHAKVEGGEGELYFKADPGMEITYIDAVSEGKKIAIEFSENEVELFTGRPLLKRDIVIKE